MAAASLESPNDATSYARRVTGGIGAWAHLSHADITDWTSQVNQLISAATIGYSQLPVEVQQVPISFPFNGLPGVSAMVNVLMAMGLNVPFLLTGYQSLRQRPRHLANATFNLYKISARKLDVVDWHGGQSPLPAIRRRTWSGSGTALVAGDVLQIVAPSPQDATLSDVGITLLTTRV